MKDLLGFNHLNIIDWLGSNLALDFNPQTNRWEPQSIENIKRIEIVGKLNPDSIANFFPDMEIYPPDPILRPDADSTYFTCAGVQRVETLIRTNNGVLPRFKGLIPQIVIRSQYLDKVKEGFSTSFLNFTALITHASFYDFILQTRNFISLVILNSQNPKSVSIEIKKHYGLWANKRFDNVYLTLYYNGFEIGECVFIPSFIDNNGNQTSIVDISFGLERINFVLGFNNYYLEEFKNIYTSLNNPNIAVSLIDPIRSATLMALIGIEPSHKDPGYRLRQFIRRFLERNIEVNLSLDDLVLGAIDYWGQQGILPNCLDVNSVLNKIKHEYYRSWNQIFLKLLETEYQIQRQSDINLPPNEFLSRITPFIPKEISEKIINKLGRLLD